MEFNQKVTNVEVDPEQWTMEEVVNISGIEENEVSPIYFTIGPNPVSSKLNVYFLNTDSVPRSITITNIGGQQIFSQKTKDNHFEINTSNLSWGVYFISVTSCGHTVTKKFVK